MMNGEKKNYGSVNEPLMKLKEKIESYLNLGNKVHLFYYNVYIKVI